jgi:hypothetical protein
MRETERLGNRDARLPVAWAAAGVGESEKANNVRTLKVEHDVRETGNYQPTNLGVFPIGMTTWIACYFLQGTLDFGVEVVDDLLWRARTVIGEGLSDFLVSQRMKIGALQVLPRILSQRFRASAWGMHFTLPLSISLILFSISVLQDRFHSFFDRALAV